MLVFTSHALKPLHLNVCPSSTARNTAKSSSSSDKSPSTLIRLKTHSAMHLHNFLHYFFYYSTTPHWWRSSPYRAFNYHQIQTEHRLPPCLILDECSPYLQCYSICLFIILVVHIRDQPQIIGATHKHRHSCYCPPLFMALPLQKKKTGRFLCTKPSSALGCQIFTVLACEVISGRV